ncbi:hypothetical protein [Microbispora sp. NPDC049633]|uniref:hypothetical protein n=1 Tax=Microbispora sp. NPDC049633 TaxID=3154355 RepID=UPI0034335371
MSRTSRSIRGRCVALAAVTAGVSWLTGGAAMAKGGALADACRTQSGDVTGRDVTGRDVPGRDVPGRDVTGGLTTLAPAAGVLSIADAAGAAAGQGRNSLPTGPATTTRSVPAALPAVPGPRTLPAVPGPRTLPGAMTGAAPSAAKAAPAVPAADAKTLFPARSTVPLLAVAPAKPSDANACAPALRTAPAAHEREHPATQGHPKKGHRHPKPEGEPAGAPSRGDAARGTLSQNPGAQNPGGQNPGAQNPGAQNTSPRRPEARKPGAQKPEAQNQGTQGTLTPEGVSNSNSSQSAASGQEQSTRTFPARDRRHRKGHHPRKPGLVPPAQAANQANQAGQAGQAGRPASGTRNASLPEGERKKGAKDGRQRPDGARGTAPVVRTDAADGRHVPRMQPREYPKAATRGQNGDITAPAALTKATGTRAVTDLADATGKKLLP